MSFLTLRGNNKAFEYVETDLITTRGELRRIAWHNSVIRDNDGRLTGSLSSGEDITDRLRAQQQVRDERNLLQNVIDSIEDPILVISDSRQVLRMNRSAMRLATEQGLMRKRANNIAHELGELTDKESNRLLDTLPILGQDSCFTRANGSP